MPFGDVVLQNTHIKKFIHVYLHYHEGVCCPTVLDVVAYRS